MRILQIHNRYREPGGEDTVVAAEAGLLRDAGHVVDQYQVANPDPALAAAASLAASAWNPRSARKLRVHLDSAAPDLVHVHNTWFSLTSSIFRALHEFPVVMTIHNYRVACANAQLLRNGRPCELCLGSHPLNAIRYRCYRNSFVASTMASAAIGLNSLTGTWARHVDMFLVLTEFAKSRLGIAGLPLEKLRVKGNFVADPGPRPAAPSASKMVLFVGRISPEKGLEVALEAWERARPTELELVVVGDGPDRSRLEARGSAGVSFVGRQPATRVCEMMKTARALIFPSQWYEGQPMVLLEAFASGLPVMASRLGAMAEMLADHPRWLVDPGEVDAWVEAFRRLEDPGIDDVGASLRAAYEERHSAQTNTRALLDAYATVLR